MTDARFEDGEDGPLRLIAQSAEDVQVLSALIQDAVFPASEMRYDRAARRFAILLNRFRWEDADQARSAGRPVERVRSLLIIRDVLSARHQGIDPSDKEVILSLLAIDFAPETDGMGRLHLTFAGDGAIALQVEALDLSLEDVTRPYLAPSRKAPHHPD